MREWIPTIHVVPVRRWDGGKACPRVILELDLVNLLPRSQRYQQLAPILRRRLVVDLFDAPTCVTIRAQTVQLASERLKQREIASRQGTHQATVQRSLALNRLMAQHGSADPYRIVTEPPDDDAKWRRHRHPRYQFEPLPGYPLTLT